ncbi:MAG: molybdate ABC transporter substrate-binding protein [Rubrobacteraceae bacterium]
MLICLLPVALIFAGCGAQADSKPELTIFAASSLKDVFEDLGGDFERQNPGVKVRFNFAGSSMLLVQLQQGTSADVFASADEAKMEDALKAGQVQESRVFARNSPVVIVAAENPVGVGTLQDLTKPDLDLVLAQDDVPIAAYTEEILERSNAHYGGSFEARIMENVVSRESDVRAAANRVALGEADATFVYASDVTPSIRDRVEVVEIPEKINVVATYPIAVTEDAPNPRLAREWRKLVLSKDGQRTMEKWGFKRAR